MLWRKWNPMNTLAQNSREADFDKNLTICCCDHQVQVGFSFLCIEIEKIYMAYLQTLFNFNGCRGIETMNVGLSRLNYIPYFSIKVCFNLKIRRCNLHVNGKFTTL